MPSRSEERRVENQRAFRLLNMNILERSREKTDSGDDQVSASDPLFLYCECSDETCTSRVLIRPNSYDAVHKDGRQFVIAPNHADPDLEEVIEDGSYFWIVKKFS